LETRKKIFFSFAFISVLYFILLGIETIYASFSFNICEKPIWVQKFEKRNFDFIISGSSRAENNVDINTIEQLTNYKGLNIAYEGSAFSENYLALYTFFKNGNKAKYILLNADEWGVIDQKKAYNYPFHGYYYFNGMGNDTIDQLLKENYGSLKYFLWKYIPFVKYAEYNNIYNPCRMIYEKPLNFEKNKGADLLSSNSSKDWKLEEHTLMPDKYSVMNLNRIIELCKTYKMQLIFFNAPNFIELFSNKKIITGDTCLKLVKSIAQRNNIEYWDFSFQKEISGDRSLFYNSNHLNSDGAKMFSKCIAGRIKEKMN
jgi:hypothetical protein